MNDEVRRLVLERGVGRICHLTPSASLLHIATEGDGLLSTQQLDERHRRVFTKQDLERLDGYPDHICASLEYPNAWYLRQRRRDGRGEVRLFKDWVVLSIAPHYLWQDATLFCPRNAAARHGRLVRAGAEAFAGLYANAVLGAGDQLRRRVEPQHLRACPTDDQAEVLVHRQVRLADIDSVIVRDEAQAKREAVRLRQMGVPDGTFRYVIAPTVFDPYRLSSAIRAGRRPIEQVWEPVETGA